MKLREVLALSRTCETGYTFLLASQVARRFSSRTRNAMLIGITLARNMRRLISYLL